MTKVTLRGKTVQIDGASSKADIARALLDAPEGYSVSEISKAVPMAYSQVHSIAKTKPSEPKPMASGKFHRGPSRQKLTEAEASKWVPPEKPRTKKTKSTLGISAKVGKLRTPGHPTDIEVGECANCGHDLVVRKGGQAGYALAHVNTTAEEYLAVTQFCQAVPEALLP